MKHIKLFENFHDDFYRNGSDDDDYGLELDKIYVTTEEISPMPPFEDPGFGNGEDQDKVFQNTRMYKHIEGYDKYFKPKTDIFKIGTDLWINSIENGVVTAEARTGQKYSFFADEFAASTEIK